MSNCIFNDDDVSFSILFRNIIENEASKIEQEKLNQKLSLFVSDQISEWDLKKINKFGEFARFVNCQEISSVNKVDLLLTFSIMINNISMIDFCCYSNEEILLCSSVMKNIEIDNYCYSGSLLCNYEIVDMIMSSCKSLSDQLRVYQCTIDGVELCLNDFLKPLNLKKINEHIHLFSRIIVSMQSSISRYIKYMDLSECQIKSIKGKMWLYEG